MLKTLRALHVVLAVVVCAVGSLSQTPTQTAGPQAVTQEMRVEANQFFQRQDWPNSVKAYEVISSLEPKNGGASFRLGASLHALGEYQRAVLAFQRAAEITGNPLPMYNLACSYSRLKENAKAIEWLKKAVAGGFEELDLLRTDPDLESLQGDPQFKEFLAGLPAGETKCSSAPEYRQLDFWIGDWNVKTESGEIAGTNNVQLVLGKCALLENWVGSKGGSGKSLSFYNKESKKWQQTWIDDVGGVIEAFGEVGANRMQFTTSEKIQRDGTKKITRITLSSIAGDRVKQQGESSSDGGKTWKPTFTLIYERKK